VDCPAYRLQRYSISVTSSLRRHFFFPEFAGHMACGTSVAASGGSR
jgi:hypothetical protein